MHCGFPKDPIPNCEPAAFREASGIEQSSRRCRLFSSHVSVILVTIGGPALASLPFERRLPAKGGPLHDCIISDTPGKHDLHRHLTQRRVARRQRQLTQRSDVRRPMSDGTTMRNSPIESDATIACFAGTLSRCCIGNTQSLYLAAIARSNHGRNSAKLPVNGPQAFPN
jgi:hypothetical protein